MLNFKNLRKTSKNREREQIMSFSFEKNELLEIVKKYRYNFSDFLPESDRTLLGKYYTPPHLVDLVYKLVSPFLDKDTIILDPACGLGAFFKENLCIKYFIGVDIDKNVIEILRRLGYDFVYHDNFLLNVDRKKYNIDQGTKLVVVGNPPYNDFYSKNKRTQKSKGFFLDMDPDIKTRDLGISFLRAIAKLFPDFICVLHPLSYLIKPRNFRLLGFFSRFYRLKKAVIFSSQEFTSTRKTPFPVVAALYSKFFGGMDYDYIFSFPFDIYNEPKKKFLLSKIETIDGYINKYPPKMGENFRSDIGLYMFNFRDLNSLLTSGGLTEKFDPVNNITIHYSELYKYAYLNAMKRYFGKNFLFGNLSPIVRKQDLESNDFLKDIFIIDTIIHNQHLSVLNVKNKNSIIWTKKLYQKFKEKQHSVSTNFNPYKIFLNFVKNHGEKNKTNDINLLENFIKQYFDNLKKEMI